MKKLTGRTRIQIVADAGDIVREIQLGKRKYYVKSYSRQSGWFKMKTNPSDFYKINHPHIVKVKKLSNRSYKMDGVGVPIGYGNKLDEPQIRQIISALKYLDKKNLYHEDLHCHNVCIRGKKLTIIDLESLVDSDTVLERYGTVENWEGFVLGSIDRLFNSLPKLRDELLESIKQRKVWVNSLIRIVSETN